MLERETFVPQHYVYGVEAQVDWYEALAEVGGQRETFQVFTMRSMASGGAFHRAYRRATQQAFLEGHELAFRHFGGCFQRVRYDNLTLAVKKVLRGSRREETQRFHAFRSHWRFESIFCLPGNKGAHEKGGVEGEVGTFRRNHWVPVPKVRDLKELNQQIPAAVELQESAIKESCQTLRLPTIASQSVQLAQEAEKDHQTYLGYLGALLDAEVDERERNTVERRINDAHLPRFKTLEEFDFSQSSNISPTRIQELAQGGYLQRAEPIVLIGECGTGKTHLLTACASLPAGRSGASDSPPPLGWSMSWSRPNTRCSCDE
jgi:IstB-like ATP binding protein